MFKYLLLVPVFIMINYELFGQNVISEFRKDSVKTIAEYKFYNGFVNDSTFSVVRTCNVYMGKTGWVSDSEIETLDSYIKRNSSNTDTRSLDSSMIGQIVNNPIIVNSLHLVVLKKYNDPAYYKYAVGNQKELLIIDTALFKWKLTEEFKTIGIYKCQKAIITQSTNIISAWFTDEIPVNAGPSYIYGLPGLIVEYVNPEKHVCYKIAKISSVTITSKNKFRELPDAQMVSKSEFNKIVAEDQKKIEEMKMMIKDGKINN